MEKLNKLLSELGISKVRLAKYLGVSRQMLYNYLSFDSLSLWPNEKVIRLLALLDVEDEGDIEVIVLTNDYLIDVERRLNEGVKDSSNREVLADLNCFSKKEQELLTDIINLLKEKLQEDKTKNAYNTLLYLYHFLQSMDSNNELKYMLAYISKSMGFTNPVEFIYDKDKQFVFESIQFSAMTLYNNGGASKNRIAETHKKFVKLIEIKKEEKLSRTQELNTAKVQALKELGYEEIREDNAKEVLEKIAEIQSRKV